MAKYASVCILSYQRLDFLKRMIKSLISVDAGYGMEIIIHDDGSDQEVKDYLYAVQQIYGISYLIINNGKNRGIGEAIRNCFKIASGDYLFKLDTDIEFKEGWLREAVIALEIENTGAVSLLNYNNYNPEDDRFKTENLIKAGDNYFYEVSDFISCLYGVTRETYEKYKDHLGTDGWHQYIKSQGYKLLISEKDKIVNFGFGLGNSIYVQQNDKGEIITAKTHEGPLIFKGEK